MNLQNDLQEQAAQNPLFPGDIPPWEEIETGRFMPRRIRGSFRGQALG